MELVLSLVVPYVTDPGTAARLRVVSKNTKEGVDACHAELLKLSNQRANLRFYVRVEMARRMTPSLMMAQDNTPAFTETSAGFLARFNHQVCVESGMGQPAYHSAPILKKKPWWRFCF
jgi:hypothetical protein